MENVLETYKGFLAGDIACLESLVTEYSDQLILFVYQTVKDFDVAEDIVENAFVTLGLGKKTFGSVSEFERALFEQTVKALKSADKSEKNKATPNVFGASSLTQKRFIEKCFSADERKAKFGELISEAPEEARATLVAVLFFGLKPDAVASILELKIEKVKSDILTLAGKVLINKEETEETSEVEETEETEETSEDEETEETEETFEEEEIEETEETSEDEETEETEETSEVEETEETEETSEVEETEETEEIEETSEEKKAEFADDDDVEITLDNLAYLPKDVDYKSIKKFLDKIDEDEDGGEENA